MKKTLLLLSTVCCFTTVFAQSESEQKAWMAFMTPGEEHKMLAKDDGQWNEEVTVFMDPSVPPMKSKSVCTNTMMLGGRYQRSIHKGDMMGMPFEGESTVGYDNGRKVWFSTWVDNMGTGIMYGEGVFDKSKNALVLTGKMTDPSTSKAVDYKEVMTFQDADHQKMEMYLMVEGKEIKTMEILFTRMK